MQEEEVDVGVRKEPAAAESAERNQHKAGGAVFFRGDDLLPEALYDGLDQAGALLYGSAAVARISKLLLDPGGFFRVQVPQIAAQ
jgi:hypothetical protein